MPENRQSNREEQRQQSESQPELDSAEAGPAVDITAPASILHGSGHPGCPATAMDRVAFRNMIRGSWTASPVAS